MVVLAAAGWPRPAEIARIDTPRAVSDDDPGRALRQNLAERIVPFLDTYCLGCHTGEDAEAGLRLDEFTSLEAAGSGQFDLRLIREVIRGEHMPPKRKRQPTDSERREIAAWLDGAVAYIPSDVPVDPGWFTIHRLNRREYASTLRDLLGLDPAVADELASGLPQDDTGYGFDNIADVLSTSPLAIEQYLSAAERAIDSAMGPIVEIGDHPTPIRPLKGSNGQALPRGGVFLYSNGAATGRFAAPLTAEYRVRVQAWETHAGNEYSRLSLRVDQREIREFSVAGTRGEPQEFELTVQLDAGDHAIAAHFVNDYYVKDQADRNLAIESISVAGPLDESSTQRPASWTRVFGAGDRAAGDADRAQAILSAFASRAYRRPASDDAVGSLVGVYQAQREAGSGFESAVRTAMSAALVSPRFLFRFAVPEADVPPGRPQRLGAYELASRLSYFLWSSMPDEALLSAAADGSLLSDETLSAQVRRLLADKRADAFIENFSGQWLQLRGLERVAIDRSLFPGYDDALRRDMKTEATLFFADVLRSDRSVLEFVQSRATFLNRRLAEHYGIPGVTSDEFQQVEIPDGSPRGGVLTMGVVLTLTSNPTRTSPVKRGLFVLDQILGSPPPPPPPQIPPLEQSIAANPSATVRERLLAHVADAACASCHRRLDPIGLTFEHFDAVGRWRDAEHGTPIDSSGTLPGRVELAGIEDLKRHLLANSDQVIEAIAAKVLIYALGRGTEPFDRLAIRRIAARTHAHADRFGALIESVVLSDTFRSFRTREPQHE